MNNIQITSTSRSTLRLPFFKKVEAPVRKWEFKNDEPKKTYVKRIVKEPQQETVSAKKPKNKPLTPEQYNAILEILTEKYPHIFGDEIKILAVGIHLDVAKELELSRMVPRKFFRKYCRTKEYQRARQMGVDRYDLLGNIVGKVTEVDTNVSKIKEGDHGKGTRGKIR